jgi:hypothetical protein
LFGPDLGIYLGVAARLEEVRFARGANNPPFAMRLRRMGHPDLMRHPDSWVGRSNLMGHPDLRR